MQASYTAWTPSEFWLLIGDGSVDYSPISEPAKVTTTEFRFVTDIVKVHYTLLTTNFLKVR